MAATATLTLSGPYDLALTLRAAGSFTPGTAEPPDVFRAAVTIGGTPTLVEVRQPSVEPPVLDVRGSPKGAEDVVALAARMLFADLDLRPFYRGVADYPVFGAIVQRLGGLKPLRPASLFEMLTIAVVEQQISLVAAHAIRARLVERFGEPVDDLVAFPEPDALAAAPQEELKACVSLGARVSTSRDWRRP